MKKIEHIVEYLADGDDLIYNDNHGRLVRCKDCKWSGEPHEEWGVANVVWCKSHGCLRNPRWFCADGRERNG